MWVMWFFVSYLVLALLIPVAWSVGRVYARVRSPRTVTCPADRQAAVIAMDVRHAIGTHILADCSLRVESCSAWPERRNCAQECLAPLRVA